MNVGPSQQSQARALRLSIVTMLGTVGVPLTAIAQSYNTGSGPYVSPYTQGPTRPFDGTPRSGVYANNPAPRYDRARRPIEPRRPAYPTPAPIATPAIWRGVYAGATGGFQSGSKDLSRTFSNGSLQLGGHFGTHVHYGHIVVGIEADASHARASSGNTTSSSTLMLRDSWTSTVRARAGYAFGSALLYATGGLALTDQLVQQQPPSGTGTLHDLRFGYVLGGGIDYKIAHQISTRIEALHYGATAFSGSSTKGAPFDSNVVRAGVSFHFK